MEGFDPDSLDKILRLKGKRTAKFVLRALGYWNVEKDWLVNLKKVRKSTEDLATFID